MLSDFKITSFAATAAAAISPGRGPSLLACGTQKMKKVVITKIKLWAQALLIAGACAGQAHAFTNDIAPFTNTTPLGICNVWEVRDTDRIGVFFYASASDPDPVAFAGGNQWVDAAIDTRFQGPVTRAKVASCLGLAEGDVEITDEDGADGTFATDTYVGFTFTTSVDSTYPAYPAGTYEFAVEEAPANTAPTANAGPDQTVASAAAVTLDGTGSSDPEGQALTYAWTAPAGVTLSDTAAASPTFTAPTLAAGAADQVLTFSLTVTDSLGLASTADTVTVTVTAPANTAPTANAGPDQTVASATASAALDGTGSSDPDAGQTLTYAWTAPAGVTLSDATAASPTYTAPTLAAGAANRTLTFSLIVTDSLGLASTADTVTVTVTADPQTPAAEFEAAQETIHKALTGDAIRSLRNGLAFQKRMTSDARLRFLESQDPEAAGDTCVPVDVDGGLEVNGVTASSKGTFYGNTCIGDGVRRLVFGDFDIQHDGDTGTSSATLNGRVAWERMVSDKTMLGYFIGGELARSNIAGDFDGTQNRVGVTVGGYGVHALADQILLDGFFSLGAGRNNLEMADTVLALESDYSTRTAIVGAALTGMIQQDGFEIWPELSFSYGRTWIGNVDFTGSAYSLVDDTLSLDAGQVTLANILLRPEVRVPLDGLSGANSLQVVTFAPRLLCEQIKTTSTEQNCGGGAEVGFSGRSADGMSSVKARLMADRIGGSTKSSLQLNLEHRF